MVSLHLLIKLLLIKPSRLPLTKLTEEQSLLTKQTNAHLHPTLNTATNKASAARVDSTTTRADSIASHNNALVVAVAVVVVEGVVGETITTHATSAIRPDTLPETVLRRAAFVTQGTGATEKAGTRGEEEAVAVVVVAEEVATAAASPDTLLVTALRSPAHAILADSLVTLLVNALRPPVPALNEQNIRICKWQTKTKFIVF